MVQKSDCRNIVLSIAAGLLAVSAFPNINLFTLIWVAFIPLIFLSMKASGKGAFLYGFSSGLVFNITGLYWLIPMLKFNMGSYVQAVITACPLWLYLALYWGIWSLCLNLLKNPVRKVIKKEVYADIFFVIIGSCMWVLLEYVRTYSFTGFPWMLIGYSQFNFTEIIQIAEFTGIYGISFLIILCNFCLYFWLCAQKNNKYLYAVVAVITAVVIFGAARINKFKFLNNDKFSVSVVQPNIDQYKKMDKSYRNNILLSLKECACEISKNKTDLTIWPESIIMEFIPDDEQLYNEVKVISNITGGCNIVGSLYHDRDNTPYNAVLFFENGDSCKVVHKKNHLVPFGEFIPFRKYISRQKLLFKNLGIFLTKISDFEKGKDTNVFNNGRICVGSSICSENFFPDISRKFVLHGAKVLTNHTNDAWFFDTAMLYQHFMMNIFRAVENRKTVIVSANSGISGIIDAAGFVVNRTVASKKALIRDIFFQNDYKTFYTKYGDVFVYVCTGLIFSVIMLLCICFF